MHLRISRTLLAALAGLVLHAPGGLRAQAPAEVIVLSTLHQLHPRVPGYGFEELSGVIERLAPDVLAVELTAEDVAERKPQKTKREYPESVYPLLEKHGYAVVPLEPSEPLYSEIVGPYAEAQRAFAERSPEAARAFATYGTSLYDYLFAHWDSPASVNSAATDALLAVKHAFQDAVMPPPQAAGWEAWNQHFLRRIVDAARASPGKRIVVLVGVEHGYWLRAHLRGEARVRLVDTEALLRTPL
jgi:hypothetical protein